MGFEGSVALITGGARGIGRAIADELAAGGATLAIVDVLQDVAEATAAEFRARGVTAAAFVANVSSLADVERMFGEVLTRFGKVDILVNNAGITRDNLIMRMREEEWDAVIAVNLKGTFNCIKAASRPMLKARSGRIVNIASVVGVMGNAGQANYSASKAGVIGLTKTAAKELASRGITVNAVAPGYIRTEMTDKLSDAAREAFLTLVPLARAGTPEDVARAVGFLCSEAAAYITGQVLHVDGGMVM
jgi:3-oxoacyl-[acyl-carrier protein] reductase